VLDQYKNKVKLVFKNFPSSDHKFAFMAAVAALSANEQNKFWEYHQNLFDNFDTLDESKIRALAYELSLDMDKFNADMKSPSIQGVINRDIEDGLTAGVSGIPAVFVNGKMLENYTLQGLQQTIESELNEKAKSHPDSNK